MRSDPPRQLAVAGRNLLLASIVALLGAAAIFAIAVLPAEYGVDPLGTGKALGLLAINPPAPPPAPVLTGVLPVQAGPMTHYSGALQSDSIELTVNPYDYVEYKYHLAKGASIVFSWAADAMLIHDFHGEPDTYPKDKVQSYDKSKRQAANGSLVAPFSGIHGWYWENPGATPIRVKLVSAGFYTGAIQIKSNHVRIPRRVRPLADLPPEDLSALPAKGAAPMKRLPLFLAALVAILSASGPLRAHENYRTIGVISNRYVNQNKSTIIEVTQSDGDGVTSIVLTNTTAVTRDNNKVPETDLQKGLTVVIDSYGDGPDYSDALVVKIVPPIPQAK